MMTMILKGIEGVQGNLENVFVQPVSLQTSKLFCTVLVKLVWTELNEGKFKFKLTAMSFLGYKLIWWIESWWYTNADTDCDYVEVTEYVAMLSFAFSTISKDDSSAGK